MVTLNRATRRVLKPTRVRLHSAVAGIAFALIGGLSAPAAAAAAGTHHTTNTGTTTVAAATAKTGKAGTRPRRGSPRPTTCTPPRSLAVRKA